MLVLTLSADRYGIQAVVFSALYWGHWSASRPEYSKTGRYSCT